jgi:hypothetical protein
MIIIDGLADTTNGGGGGGGSNNNSEIIDVHSGDNPGVNYRNIDARFAGYHHHQQQQQQPHHHHLENHQKFDLSNKHISSNASNEKAISYNQQATRSNLSDSSLPLDLCQVNMSIGSNLMFALRKWSLSSCSLDRFNIH